MPKVIQRKLSYGEEQENKRKQARRTHRQSFAIPEQQKGGKTSQKSST